MPAPPPRQLLSRIAPLVPLAVVVAAILITWRPHSGPPPAPILLQDDSLLDDLHRRLRPTSYWHAKIDQLNTKKEQALANHDAALAHYQSLINERRQKSQQAQENAHQQGQDPHKARSAIQKSYREPVRLAREKSRALGQQLSERMERLDQARQQLGWAMVP